MLQGKKLLVVGGVAGLGKLIAKVLIENDGCFEVVHEAEQEWKRLSLYPGIDVVMPDAQTSVGSDRAVNNPSYRDLITKTKKGRKQRW